MIEQNETKTKRSHFDILRDVHGVQLTAFRAETTTKIVGLRTVNRQKPGTADELETVRQLVEIDVSKKSKVGCVCIGGKFLAEIHGPTNRFIERMCLNAVIYYLNECRRVKATHKKAKAAKNGAFYTPEAVLANPPFDGWDDDILEDAGV